MHAPPHLIRRILSAALLAHVAAGAQSQQRPQPLWEVGGVALGVSQQAYPGSDRQLQRGLAVPYVIYRGRFLRADSEGVGIRPIRTPTFELDVSAAAAFGSRASEDPARAGMPDLGTLVEFGPRVKWNLAGTPETGRWRIDLPLRGVFDLDERLDYRGAVFQPALVWHRRNAGWNLTFAGSLLFADRRLAATFFEVAPAYATAARPAYEARAGLLATRLSASVSRELTRDWSVFGFARVESVAGAANRTSPLVRQTTGATVGVGVAYTWWRSARPAAD